MPEFLGNEALTAIFQILIDNFLRLTKVKLNGTVITADTDKVIDICPTANDVSYSHTGASDISDVKDALDKLFETSVVPTAENVSYDNSLSGFDAENVQDALDEMKEYVDTEIADAIGRAIEGSY